MKKLVYLIIVISLAACSTDTLESKRQKIEENKKTINSLQLENAKLEKEVLEMGDSTANTTVKVPVKVQTLKMQPFAHYFSANGTVEAVQMAYVSPETAGQIKKIAVKEGDRVKKGQLLARINSSVTESTIKEIETSMELANTVYKKQKELWDRKIGSELEYLQAKNNKESLESRLETLKTQYDMAFVKAPFDGIIDDVIMKEGELIQPGMRLIQLVNLSSVMINADVAETYLPKVFKGEEVIVTFPAYPDIEIKTTIYRVGNVIKEANRTFNVQLRIPNIDEQLKPNLIALVEMQDFHTDATLIVPSIIVKNDFNGSYVFIAETIDGVPTATKRYIETGIAYKENSMVLSGLKEGDKVIVSGYNTVTEGIAVNIM